VLLFSGKLLCTVILTDKKEVHCYILILLFVLFLLQTYKGKDMNSPIINKDIFGEYVMRFVMYILLNVS